MKKVKTKTIEGKSGKDIVFPKQFSEPVRKDLIKLAVLAIQANKRQPYGAKPTAGKRASAELSRRRHDYRGSYGHGISRVPRKIFSRQGTRMNWEAAFAPGTVGGRKAHPPKAEKIWEKKINIKQRRKAIRSALSASIDLTIVKKRGHLVEDYPLIIDDKFESVSKTKEVKEILKKIGLEKELDRCSVKKVRAGKGKSRGRKYKTKKGPLIVVSKDCPLIKSAGNIPGVDVEVVRNINAELLAPGTVPGRATIYTESSINDIETKHLFTDKVIKEKKDLKDNRVENKKKEKKEGKSRKAGKDKKEIKKVEKKEKKSEKKPLKKKKKTEEKSKSIKKVSKK